MIKQYKQMQDTQTRENKQASTFFQETMDKRVEQIKNSYEKQVALI